MIAVIRDLEDERQVHGLFEVIALRPPVSGIGS